MLENASKIEQKEEQSLKVENINIIKSNMTNLSGINSMNTNTNPDQNHKNTNIFNHIKGLNNNLINQNNPTNNDQRNKNNLG